MLLHVGNTDFFFFFFLPCLRNGLVEKEDNDHLWSRVCASLKMRSGSITDGLVHFMWTKDKTTPTLCVFGGSSERLHLSGQLSAVSDDDTRALCLGARTQAWHRVYKLESIGWKLAPSFLHIDFSSTVHCTVRKKFLTKVFDIYSFYVQAVYVLLFSFHSLNIFIDPKREHV